jgi:hypothetical protein
VTEPPHFTTADDRPMTRLANGMLSQVPDGVRAMVLLNDENGGAVSLSGYPDNPKGVVLADIVEHLYAMAALYGVNVVVIVGSTQ